MSWSEHTHTIDTWELFEKHATKLVLPYESRASYLLRGQADVSWALLPSLNRLFTRGAPAEQMLAIERSNLTQFQKQAHLHLPQSSIPDASGTSGGLIEAEWWALMQHYSAPTRMLDWTLSPYVALYFAVERELEKDGVIFVIPSRAVSESFHSVFPEESYLDQELFFSPTAPASVLVWAPKKSTERIVAQQGYFTLGTQIASDQGELIAKQCDEVRERRYVPPDRKLLLNERWIIPAGKKLWFLQRLRMMNIGAHSLFPGIDGLGRSLAEDARLSVIPTTQGPTVQTASDKLTNADGT